MLRHAVALTALAAVVGCSQTTQTSSVSTVEGKAMSTSSRETLQERSVGLTIYSSADPAGFDPQRYIAENQQGYNPHFAWQVPGYGVVRDTRRLDLKAGRNIVSFTDVAQFIDPTTVSLVDLSVPAPSQESAGVKVLEQKFAFDLVSPEKLLESYVDQTITLNVNQGDGRVEKITGKLLSSNQGRIVLQTANGVRILSNTGDIQLGELPGGLITKPTLQWELNAPVEGPRMVRTAYQTGGITWRADYNLVISEDESSANLGAWVTVMNLSGMSYPNAELKLIAGDVNRAQTQHDMREKNTYGAFRDGSSAFEEKAFFEYHMYTLPRKVTIDQNTTQQLVLFPTAHDVKVQKVLVYYGLPADARYWVFPEPVDDRNLGSQANTKLDVYIQFENKVDNKLGIPLPSGKIRAFKMDGGSNPLAHTGSLEFIGEDLIDHTPKNQQVMVKLGQSFDVTGNRVQTDYTSDIKARVITETIRITLKNAKDTPQNVTVRETLYRWTNWKITEQSDAHEKIDSRTIHFNVTVPPEGEKTVTYTVQYTW